MHKYWVNYYFSSLLPIKLLKCVIQMSDGKNSRNDCLDSNFEFRKQFWSALGPINEIHGHHLRK